ncbi:MAG: PAS domain S-box protein [Thermoguttaceae bacterium]
MKAIVFDPRQERQRLVQAVLEDHGHQVTVVASVHDLLATRRAGGHPLLFLAAEILRQKGLPLTQQLRLPHVGGTCLILALAGGCDDDPSDLLAAGVDDILASPLDPRTLALRTSIAEHHLRRALRRELWFEALISLGNTVYAVTDAQGTTLYASPSLQQLSGVEPAEIIGKNVFDLAVPEDAELARRLLADVVSSPGQTTRARLRCRSGHDAPRVVEASIRNCLDDPLIGGLIVTATDVTRQHQIESDLETTEARYRTLVETAREGIVICDPDENLVFVNPAFAELLGYRREEMTGMNLRQLTDAGQFARLQQETALRRRGIASRFEVRLSTRQNDSRILAVSAAPLLCESGDFLGTLEVTTDITDRRLEAERLRKSEERFRLIAENVSDVIWTRQLPEPVPLAGHSPESDVETVAARMLENLSATYVSPSVTRMLGYDVSEALALSLRDTVTPKSYARLRQFIASSLLRPRDPHSRPSTLELEYVRKDGAARWGEITGSFLLDEQRRITGTLVVTRDISERKQVEAALLDSEHRLRRLIENMPDFVVLVDASAEIHYVNREVGGLKVEQLVGRRGFGFLLEQYHPACQAAFDAALQTGEVQFVDAQDIFGLWWSCRLVPLKEKTVTTNVMIICTDVTEQKRAQAAVCEEQDLLRRLIELHERDRKVLAFELHDGFAQQLTGAMMSLEVASRLTVTAPEKAAAPLGDAVRLLRESIEESRRLVGGLCPPVLEQFGIVAAIEHLVDLNQSDRQLVVEFVTRGRSRRLASPLENAVFRIVQETLTNVRRHSGSRRALVELYVDERSVSVAVQDWGTGFDPGRVDEACFGLRGIRERTRLLGGNAEIDSAPGRGTTVRISLPMIEPHQSDGNRGDANWEPM